jgi:hypothetical protein
MFDVHAKTAILGYILVLSIQVIAVCACLGEWKHFAIVTLVVLGLDLGVVGVGSLVGAVVHRRVSASG